MPYTFPAIISKENGSQVKGRISFGKNSRLRETEQNAGSLDDVQRDQGTSGTEPVERKSVVLTGLKYPLGV